MNPSLHKQTTNIPEFFKSLFRPIACLPPEKEIICCVFLFSIGFSNAQVNKIICCIFV